MTIQAKTYTPYAEVEFHTDQELYAVSRGGGWANIQPTRDLISVQTQKDLGSPVGTWQVILTGARGGDGMDWYDRLKENDLVCIKMGRPPETMATVMVGLIDEVRRTKIMGGDGQPERRVMVRGSDFGKVLTRAMLRFYPSLANANLNPTNSFYQTPGGWQAMFNFFVGADLITGKPADMIKQAMYRVLFRIMNMRFKYWDTSEGEKDVHLVNLLRFRLCDTPNIIPFLLTMLDYEGAFWNFIERVAIKPFNELFVDVRGDMPNGYGSEYMRMTPNSTADSFYSDAEVSYMAQNGISGNPQFSATFGEDNSKVVLFLRNTPYDYDRWNDLYTHTLSYDDIISEDLGRSDHENYNTFMAYNSLSIPSPTNLKLLVQPVIDQDNAALYGMSPLEVQIEGISITDDKVNLGIEAAQALSQTLYRWYRLNKDYKTGTITVRGNGFYKVGQRLHITGCEYDSDTKKWDDLYFYIEGVQQSFTMLEGWTTTLTLTRGQRLETTAPAPVAKPGVPTASTTAATTPNQTYYTVQSGDTLWGIAYKKYGNGLQWTQIWNANKDALIQRDNRNENNPGQFLYDGMDLLIPD